MSKLVGIKTYERFRSLWENDAIDDFSLNFIIDTGLLYTHGIFINGAVFGTAANDAVPLSIAGTTNTLALSSHTHSNYLEKNADIDISNYKIKSGNKDLLFYSGGSLYLGNDASPTYISGSNLYSVRENTVHEILDTSNFSISNTLPTGYTYNNTAYIRYGSNSHQIDYVKRINTSLSFDYLNTYTLAGTNTLNGILYGYITLYTDNVYTNPSWALLRINIPNKVMLFRTSADPNNWIGFDAPTIPNNALNVAGIVAAPSSTTTNKVWKTDESGNPAWRDETSYTFSNLKFLLISGTDLMTYNTLATKTILAGSNISFTHDNGVLTIKAQDTTYGVVSKTSAGLAPQLPNETTTTKFLRQDGTWATPTYTSDTNTWRPIKVNGTEKRGTAITSGDLNFINGSNTTVEWTSDNKLKINSTWTAWKGATDSANGTAGYMPAPTSAQRGQFLRGDGSWVSLNNYSLPTASNSTLGGVKTGAAITDTTGYTAVAIKDGIIYYKDTNTTYTFYNLLFQNSGGTTVDTYKPTTSPTKTLKAGSNVTISAASNVITIASTDTNTWRGILDNLTSSSNTTESLSAKQGYLLANGSARDSTKLPLSGANYNTATDTNPFTISRTGDTNEAMQIMVNDSRTLFKYINDETASSIIFQLVNTDTESGGGKAASDRNVTISSSNTGIYLSVGGTLVSLNGHKHAYTDLTGSGTTANLAILSNGTANGWKLATLGARAFDSTNYLPLSGGTMSGTLNMTCNTVEMNFRTGHSSYNSKMEYMTTGNEAMVWANQNAVTSFIFKCGLDLSNTSDWTGITPSLQIKNQSVYINSLIANGTTPSYNLYVNGSANATTLYENGTSLASKYLALAGGTLTGSLTINKNTYPSITLNRTDSNTEVSMYFKNATAGWAIGINPWGIGGGQFGIGQYSGTGSSTWRFKIDNNGYCFTNSYLNLGGGHEKNASSPPYVLGFNSSDTYIRSYQTSHLSVSYASSAGNADTVDSQHFKWSNDSNSPTYLWAANSSGTAFLCARGSMSVNYANSAGNADTVDSLHANKFAWVYNSANIGSSSSVTVNDMVSSGGSNATMAMIYNSTDNPTGASKWIHVWSLQWTINSAANWVSQIALGVSDGNGMWYRCSSGKAAGLAWKRVIDSSNIGSQSVNYASSAGSVAWNNVSGKPSTFTPSSHTHNYIEAKGNYTFNSSTLPNSFDYGISAGFVNSNSGFGSYGSVLTVRTYSGGGGTLQLYAPYSNSYGGSHLKARFGNYESSSGNSWTTLKTIAWTEDIPSTITWGNVTGKPSTFTPSSHTHDYLPLSGGSLTGLLSVRNTGNTAAGQYNQGAMLIREYNYGGSQSDTWGNAPRLTWHWSGRVAAQIGLASNGYLYEAPVTGTNFYRLVYESGTWGINVTGSAGSVAWSNVSGRPTNLNLFTNGPGYITSSGSCSYATTAGTANSVAFNNIANNPFISLFISTNQTRGTGINVNAKEGGRTLLILMSGQCDSGNATASRIYMVRCGYSGNNYNLDELHSRTGNCYASLTASVSSSGELLLKANSGLCYVAIYLSRFE